VARILKKKISYAESMFDSKTKKYKYIQLTNKTLCCVLMKDKEYKSFVRGIESESILLQSVYISKLDSKYKNQFIHLKSEII
jgi:hypothetical protein